jgi:PKD repeat protein
MLLNLVKTFDTPPGFSDFVGSQARVRRTGTQDPARLYTAEGALLSANGQVDLGSDGLLDVWVAQGTLYDLDLLNPTGRVVSTVQGIDPSGGAGMSREQSNQLAQLYAAGAEAGNVVYGAKSVAVEVAGLEVTLSDLVLTNALTAGIQTNVDWGDDNTTISAGDLRSTTAQHTYAAGGNYVVKVTPKATNSGVLGTAVLSNVAIEAPGLELTVGRYTDPNIVIEVGWIISISYVSTLIDWGDGTTTELGDTSLLAHTYAEEGTYTITVTERVDGVPTGLVGEITFDTATAEDFGPNPYGPRGVASSKNAIDDVTLVQFSDQSQFLDGEVATTWLWDFGDAGTSTLQNPTHTYAAAGTFNVTLVANGRDPVAVASIVVVAAPAAPSVTVEAADTFAVDGPLKDRALTTQMAGVFETWSANDNTNPLTAGGKLTSAVPGAFAQFNTQQWDFGAPVVPPAELEQFVIDFDFTPGVTSAPESPYSYSSQWDFNCTGTASATNDGSLFKLTVQAGIEADQWTFSGDVFGTFSPNVVNKVVPQGDSIHIKLVMTDTEAYILIGDSDIMVFDVAGRGVIGAMNQVSMQLGPPVGGTPALDNFVISSVT